MVSRILEQVQAICIVLSADRKYSHLLPTWQDTEVLEAISIVLSSLDDLTDFLSGELYVSISSIRSVIKHIHEEALVEKDDDVSLVRDMKRRIRTDLDSRYTDSKVQYLLDISSFLDPRFKVEHIAEENQTAFKEAVIQEGLQIFHLAVAEETEPAQSSLTSVATSSSDPCDEQLPLKKKSKLARILKSSNDSEQRRLTPRDKVVKEVRSYTDRPCIDVDDDPLEWWRIECRNYPCLSHLASKYLSVCATSSPSERVFSASGKIVTPHRSHLKPAMVDKLVFLSQNLA